MTNVSSKSIKVTTSHSQCLDQEEKVTILCNIYLIRDAARCLQELVSYNNNVTLGKFLFQVLRLLSSLCSPAADKVHFMNFCLNYEECKILPKPEISRRTFSIMYFSSVHFHYYWSSRGKVPPEVSQRKFSSKFSHLSPSCTIEGERGWNYQPFLNHWCFHLLTWILTIQTKPMEPMEGEQIAPLRI